MNYLKACQRVYLVSFRFQGANNKFICQDNQLIDVLKTEDQNGLESIKVFRPEKNDFIRVARPDVLRFASWDTEASEYLKAHYFFK